MSTVTAFLQAKSRGRWIVSSLIATLLCLALFHPYRVHFESLCPGQVLPDLLGPVGPSELHAHLERLGAAGRQAYWPIACIDMLFPLAYGSLMVFSTAWALGDLAPDAPRLRWGIALPLIAVLADFVENLLVQRAVAIFPQPLELRGWLWSAAHCLKWLAVFASLLSVAAALQRKFRSSRA